MAREIWVSFGTLYQIYNRNGLCKGCFSSFERARAAMSKTYTMDILDDQRTRHYGEQRRLLLRTLTYPQVVTA